MGQSSTILVKYNPEGKLLWAQHTYNGYSFPIAIAADAKSNLFLVGEYNRSITLGSIVLDNIDTATFQLFLAKYDPDGRVEWAINLCRASYDFYLGNLNTGYFGGLAVNNNNIYVSASFLDKNLKVGPYILSNKDSSGMTSDMMIAKIDDDGNINLVKSIGGKGSDITGAISSSSSSSGSVYMAGTFSSDSINFGTALVANTGLRSIIILKFDSLLNPLWGISTGGNSDAVCAIANDNGDNVYLAGGYSDKVFVETDTFIAPSHTYGNFLMKLSSSGNFLWAKNITGNNYAVDAYSIAIDKCNNVWLSGSLGSNADTLKVSIDNHNFSVYNQADPLYISEWDNSATYLNTEIIPTGGDDIAGICTDGNGNIYLGGDYLYFTKVTFGTTTLYDTTDLFENMMIAKYSIDKIDTIRSKSSGCIADSMVLDAPAGYLYYLWNNGNTQQYDTIYNNGIFWVSAIGGCGKPFLTDTFSIFNGSDNMVSSLGNDTAVCGDLLLAPFPNTIGSTFLWQDGSTANNFLATQAGSYSVTITSNGCTLLDNIVIYNSDCQCSISIPNAFSPDKDGHNDYFHPLISPGCELKDFYFSIYNRWGQKIFSSENPDAKWDGTYNGVNADIGVYMYYLKYTEVITNSHHTKKGDITLIR